MNSLRLKLILVILLAVIPAFTITLVILSNVAAERLRHDAREQLEQTAELVASQIDHWHKNILAALQNLSMQEEIRSMDPQRQKIAFQRDLELYPELFLIHSVGLNYFNIVRTDTDSGQDFHNRSYIRNLFEHHQMLAEEVIISKSKKLPALAIGAAIEDNQKKTVGAVAFVTSLRSLSQVTDISRFGTNNTGYVMVVDAEGEILSHPDHKYLLTLIKNTQFPPVKFFLDHKTGFLEFTNEKGMICFAHIVSLDNGWGVISIQNADDLYTDVNEFVKLALALSLATFALLILFVWFSCNQMFRPIQDLKAGVELITAGDFHGRVPEQSRDEIGELARAFNKMVATLDGSREQLRETTAVKERIESEVKIAKQIQTSLLPTIFPPYPNSPEFDLYACMEPAREVGGDFYDFYFIGEKHLCIVVGDVSDKGIPAALFMAVTKTLLKANTGPLLQPHEVITRVNQELSRENDAANFVTIFYGILDIQTGQVAFCNAGHNQPYILRTNGVIETPPKCQGLAVGVLEDYSYETKYFHLAEEDSLIIFTDGVTEAKNKEGKFLGEEVIKELLTRLPQESPEKMVKQIMQKVQVFASGCTQADDITLLAVKFRGQSPV